MKNACTIHVLNNSCKLRVTHTSQLYGVHLSCCIIRGRYSNFTYDTIFFTLSELLAKEKQLEISPVQTRSGKVCDWVNQIVTGIGGGIHVIN